MWFPGTKIVITKVSKSLKVDKSRVIRPGTRGYICGIGTAYIMPFNVRLATLLTISEGHSSKFRVRFRIVPLTVGAREYVELTACDPETQIPLEELCVKFSASAAFKTKALNTLKYIVNPVDLPIIRVNARSVFDRLHQYDAAGYRFLPENGHNALHMFIMDHLNRTAKRGSHISACRRLLLNPRKLNHNDPIISAVLSVNKDGFRELLNTTIPIIQTKVIPQVCRRGVGFLYNKPRLVKLHNFEEKACIHLG